VLKNFNGGLTITEVVDIRTPHTRTQMPRNISSELGIRIARKNYEPFRCSPVVF